MADNLDLDQYQIIGEPKGGKKTTPVTSGVNLNNYGRPGQDLKNIGRAAGEAVYNASPAVKTLVDRRDAYFNREKNAIKPGVASAAPGTTSVVPSLDEQKKLTHSAPGTVPIYSGTATDAPVKTEVPPAAGGAKSLPVPANYFDQLKAKGYDLANPEVRGGVAAMRMKAGNSLTNEDMTSLYGGTNVPAVAGAAGPGTPSGAGDVVATDTGRGASGLDTQGIDIAGILEKFMGPQAKTSGMNMSALPGGHGLFSALLGIASVIGNQRRAQQLETQRYHRGIEMTKLVSDVMEKNRGYGLNLRKLEMEEPLNKAQTEYAKAHAGLAESQSKAQLSRSEQLQASSHTAAAASASRTADAMVRDNPGADWRDAYDVAYNAEMRVNDSGARNKTKYDKFVTDAKKAKMTDDDIYNSLAKAGWSDEQIQTAGGATPKKGTTATAEDIAFTAKKYNISEAEVKKRLGIK